MQGGEFGLAYLGELFEAGEVGPIECSESRLGNACWEVGFDRRSLLGSFLAELFVRFQFTVISGRLISLRRFGHEVCFCLWPDFSRGHGMKLDAIFLGDTGLYDKPKNLTGKASGTRIFVLGGEGCAYFSPIFFVLSFGRRYSLARVVVWSFFADRGFAMRGSAGVFENGCWRRFLGAAVVLVCFAARAEAGFIVDGTVADKQQFLSYLNLYGADLTGVVTPFSYATNPGVDGASVLVVDTNDVVSHFGSRMAAAIGSLNTLGADLTVEVGQNIPRIFMGGFRYDPGPPPVSQAAGHQTIDLADLNSLQPYSRVDHVFGGTDLILHEVYEGIAGLGSVFGPAHTTGIEEENSNRSAEGIRGVRVEGSSVARGMPLVDRLSNLQSQSGFVYEITGDPTQDDSIWFINKTNKNFLFFTPWDILDPTNDPSLTKEGWLQISGQIVGAGALEQTNVKDVQPGTSSVGGEYGIDSFTQFDIQVDSVTFVVPEPSTGVLAAVALLVGAVLGRGRWLRRT